MAKLAYGLNGFAGENRVRYGMSSPCHKSAGSPVFSSLANMKIVILGFHGKDGTIVGPRGQSRRNTASGGSGGAGAACQCPADYRQAWRPARLLSFTPNISRADAPPLFRNVLAAD